MATNRSLLKSLGERHLISLSDETKTESLLPPDCLGGNAIHPPRVKASVGAPRQAGCQQTGMGSGDARWCRSKANS
ncbi:protein of unknown function [Pararobbsia alpina]